MLCDYTEKTISLEPSSSKKEEIKRDELLICATNGYIYGVHKKNGTIIWETYISMRATVISLFVTDSDRIIAGAFGATYSLDLLTGEIKWTNNMKGFGYYEVSIISTPNGKEKSFESYQDETDEPSYSPPSYNTVAQDQQIIIACSRGGALGIDFNTGDTLWQYDCPGGGYNIPVVIVESSNQIFDASIQIAYVGSGRSIYCLNARTGFAIWTASLSCNILGSGYMTLASPWSSKLSAETNTAFSQNPTAQQAGRIRNTKNKK